MSRPIPDEVILGLLQAEPSHGYGLLERFRSKEQLGHIWHLSASQLYAVLKRLEDSGAIQGIDVESPDAPSRREYQLLPAGEQQLQDWLFEKHPSASLHRIRVIFLSKLYIASQLGQPVGEIFQNQIAACKQQHDAFQMELQGADGDINQLALDLVINQLSAVIGWLESYKKKLAKTS
jgi:DNA-binding PadR family transcriptional regulator